MASLPPAPKRLFVPATPKLVIEALDRLDQVNALAQEQISVERAEGAPLLIEGLVATPERRSDVLRALGPLRYSPAVRLELHTVAEGQEAQRESRSRPTQVETVEVMADAARGSPELREYLAAAKHLPGTQLDEEVLRFSIGALDHSAQARAHAEVLYKIARTLSPAELQSMTTEARGQWQAMVARHAEVVRRELSLIRQELEPLAGKAASSETQPAERYSGADPAAMANRLLGLTADLDKSLGEALAVSSTGSSSSSPVSIKNPQFWRNLQAAEQLAAAIANAGDR
jgi:hypothetical protein